MQVDPTTPEVILRVQMATAMADMATVAVHTDTATIIADTATDTVAVHTAPDTVMADMELLSKEIGLIVLSIPAIQNLFLKFQQMKISLLEKINIFQPTSLKNLRFKVIFSHYQNSILVGIPYAKNTILLK